MGFFKNLIAKVFKKKTYVPPKNKLGTGLIPSPTDPRDYTLGVYEVHVPDEYILKNWKVKMQGSYNSCTGHAISSAMETLSDSKELVLSPRFNWYHSRKDYMGNFPRNEGVYLRDALKSAQKTGIAPEQLCPYIYSELNETPSLFAESFARFFKIGSYYRVYTVNEIKYAIARNMPVVIGMMVWPSFMNLKQYNIPEPSGGYLGAHAMEIIGYNKDGFILLNSYSNGWGTGGIALLPYSVASNPSIVFESWCISDTIRS